MTVYCSTYEVVSEYCEGFTMGRVGVKYLVLECMYIPTEELFLDHYSNLVGGLVDGEKVLGKNLD